ncbi:768_t:CDS:2, partial [Gigaspora margarita]
DENEVYALGEKRPQPYPTSNWEKRIQTQHGGTWKNRLRAQERDDIPLLPNPEEEPDLIEKVDTPVRSDSSDTFDKFTYEEEMLDENEGYHTEESTIEDIGALTQTEEPPRQTIDEYLGEVIQKADLDEIEKEHAREFFHEEKGLFAQSTKELGKMSILTHRIDTGDAKR